MVAIKDFGMPSCCENCNINKFDYLGSQGTAHWNCAITENECEDYENKRNSDCPLVEIEERKVGKWIYDKASQNWRCSVCNETPKTLGYVGTSAFMTEHFKFCNHCGSEMVGAENE